MEIEAKVIADSVSEVRIRIVSLQLVYPRFIHSELMTHRVFSRSAMSSRAVPIAKMIEQVIEDPASPIHWGANQPGMQAEVEVQHAMHAKDLWRLAACSAAEHATRLQALNLHKQVVNRVLEPFQWMRTIITSTQWRNFFELRCHPDAQPEMCRLAECMHDAMEASVPTMRREGEWHLPYITDEDRGTAEATDVPDILRKMSAARCARVSYLNHDGKSPDRDADLNLFKRLAGGEPMHASPLEHVARPLYTSMPSRNFYGWRSFRTDWEATVGVAGNEPEHYRGPYLGVM